MKEQETKTLGDAPGGRGSSSPGAAPEGARLEWWPASRLRGKAHPLNWRKHPETQRKALRAMMARVGWAGAVIFNERTGRIIDGHLRKELAEQARGSGRAGGRDARPPMVPVLVVDLAEGLELEALASFDALGSWAGGDPGIFAELRAEVAGGMGEAEKEIAAMFAEVEGELERSEARGKEKRGPLGEEFWVEVECGGAKEQRALYERFAKAGREVRVLTL